MPHSPKLTSPKPTHRSGWSSALKLSRTNVQSFIPSLPRAGRGRRGIGGGGAKGASIVNRTASVPQADGGAGPAPAPRPPLSPKCTPSAQANVPPPKPVKSCVSTPRVSTAEAALVNERSPLQSPLAPHRSYYQPPLQSPIESPHWDTRPLITTTHSNR